jgi:DNA-binding HxlR family transcriptional regulator
MAFQRALCPRFRKAVELVGARWTGAIIQLLLPGHARFSELRLAIPEMSDRMLSERLRELEAEGIVHRTVIPDVPVRIEYALTD